jgi:polyhydroxybutyrate depolymerase
LLALFLTALPLLEAVPPANPETFVAETRTIAWNGRSRTYALFVPASPSGPLPVVVLHHGTGGSGAQMLAAWRNLAREERILLVAPDGQGKFGWSVPEDGPGMQQHILDTLQSEYRIDPRRIYLFGYSAGGDFVFYAALQQSKYFAAACIHDASLRPRQFPMLDLAERKIPIFYSVGAEDPVYPIAETRATRKAFEQRKWPLEMTEDPGGHSYEPAVTNSECWRYLKKQSLPGPPARTPLSGLWLGYALK